jgi:hypothetical protein
MMSSVVMPPSRRAASTALLACGVILVFAGFTAALGVSAAGLAASLAAVAGLLYAGAVWFGARAAPLDALVFDHRLVLAAGAAKGRLLVDLFPKALRSELEQYCRAALAGHAAHFSCAADPERRVFEVAPIRTADGLVLYGILLSGSLLSADAAVIA